MKVRTLQLLTSPGKRVDVDTEPVREPSARRQEPQVKVFCSVMQASHVRRKPPSGRSAPNSGTHHTTAALKGDSGRRARNR